MISLKATALEDAVKGKSIVMFHSPECEYCKAFMPKYRSFAESAKAALPGVVIARINLDKHGEDIFNRNVGINIVPEGVLSVVKAYPTVMAFGGNKYTVFNNSRSKQGLHQFAEEFFQEKQNISYDSAEEMVDSAEEMVDSAEEMVAEEMVGSAEEMVGSAEVDSAEEMFDSAEEMFEEEETKMVDATIQEIDGTQNGVTLFYADWCGHCKRFKPVYKEFSTHEHTMKSIKIAQIDFEKAQLDPAQAEACKKYTDIVKGFPTIVMTRDGKHTEHKGGRTVESLQEHCNTLFN